MIARDGVTGALFSSRYLSRQLLNDAAPLEDERCARLARRLSSWWKSVEASCGPATAVRALFDIAAMPLFAALGFRASDAAFDRRYVRARLWTAAGAGVELLVLPWASRPPSAWRAIIEPSDASPGWGFVFAPPYLSLLPARSAAVRRSVDFEFPFALELEHVRRLAILARAGAFDRPAVTAVAEIDRLVALGARFQDRVGDDLQHGVRRALAALAPALPRAAAPERRFEESLTLVYRILFLLFAESRELVPLHHPIYREAYAIGSLSAQARRPDGARGLWDALAAVTRLSRRGCRVDDLIVRPFNGRLFARAAAPSLETRRPAGRRSYAVVAQDQAIQQTLTALATRDTRGGREEICYADLGVEQLGAVYERVLDVDPAAFDRAPAPPRLHSVRRKQTGTFYTPVDLTEFVVRRTLAPLVAGRSADEILSLRVVDPSMGSGAFLVAACRYLSGAYERALVDDGRCLDADLGPAERVRIRRLVAERCLAGVDVNPVAVQLARLSIWLATLAHGKPLGFLDHRLRTGNSLIGASAEDLRRPAGRPRAGPAALPLFDDLEFEHSLRLTARPLRALAERPDETVDDVRDKEAMWRAITGDRSPLAPWRRAASLWCARWFADAPPSGAELRAAIDAVIRRDPTLRTAHLSHLLARAAALDERHQFFHWPFEFADIFYDADGRPRDRPGFDAVVGNPPWEMLRRDAGAGSRALVRFIRDSGVYSLCDRGHLNLYQPFLERALSLARPGGRIGLVLPWGLAVDDGAARLRRHLLDNASIDTIVGLDNAQAMFPIHRGVRFVVLVAGRTRRTCDIRARFGVKTREAVAALPDAVDAPWNDDSYPVRIAPDDLARLGGSTRRIPDLRRAGDLALLDRLTRDHAPLGSERGWRLQFGRELNATDDRSTFGDRGLPVLEGKHVQPFVVSVEAAVSRILPSAARTLLPREPFTRPRLAYRDVSGVSNRTSLIAAIVPAGAVTTHTLFCARATLPLEQQHFLCGLFNSYVLNALVRMLMGSHVTTSLIEDLPVPAWTGSALERTIARLAERLSRPRARAGWQARLQAAVARLYGLQTDELRSVLEGFPLVAADERAATLTAFERRAAGVAL